MNPSLATPSSQQRPHIFRLHFKVFSQLYLSGMFMCCCSPPLLFTWSNFEMPPFSSLIQEGQDTMWLQTCHLLCIRIIFLLLLLIYLLIYLWLYWVFVSVRGLSLVAASGGHSSPRCAGLSLSRPLLWRSTGSRRAGSVIVAHGPSCSAARGIFPDQGSNPCPLHWQADSQPLHHQGSPIRIILW